MTSRRSPANWWISRSQHPPHLQLVPPAPRMVGPQPLYPLPKPTVVPKSAPAKSAPATKPAKPTKRKHGGQMVKRSQRRPAPVKVIPPKPVCILSDTEMWCEEFELLPVYGPPAPTHKQWRQMKKAANELMRLEAGAVLKTAAERQRQLRDERIGTKIGFASYSSLKQAAS